ncbi:oxidoreductase [Clostridiales bacterium PH28_bin88]|nr:oxidoreductase [Clostridiales bacterium PH28_bin88]
MAAISRRDFLKRSVASGVTGGLILSGAGKWSAEAATGPVGTLIDLTKCDGCKQEKAPKCVSACREVNQDRFPEPVNDIHDYWPQKKHEDWSGKRHLIDRLTPYNWTYVQEVEVEHNGQIHQLFIQRRCMHCDNPPCAKLCPFGVQEKTPEGPVRIDPDGCFGGAKCRDVCPWHIPQRQAGVGIYLKIAPKLVGGGVMYKCDLCYERVRAGQVPACVETCPRQAIEFGGKEEMKGVAYERAKAVGGYVYGDQENGGTSTFYVSPVPFEKINQALAKKELKPGMPVGVENFLDTAGGLTRGVLLAPIAGAFAAGLAAYKTMKGSE